MIAIAAMTKSRVIGANGTIPWHLPGDLKFFKRTTIGHRIIMGRKTYDSIGRPLPGRENIVLSRTATTIPGTMVIRDISQLPSAAPDQKTFVIGGAEIYRSLLPDCTEVILTLVKLDAAGDTFFPAFESNFSEPGLLESTPDYQIFHYRR